MTQEPVPQPSSSSVEPMTGTFLSTAEVSPGKDVREISVCMSPSQHERHLAGFADNFGAGWLDPTSKQLRLQFQLVGMFSHARLDALWLSVQGKDEKIPLPLINTKSPAVGQSYPQIPWSGDSRFVLDEVIDLPDWAVNSASFELVAGVAGRPEKLGVIHVAGLRTQPHGGLLKLLTPASVSTVRQLVGVGHQKVRAIAEQGTRRLVQMDRTFVFFVILPTLLSSIYFGLIASDVYISESRFVVRSPQHPATGLGALFQGTGFSRSQDDTYTVHDYILSKDALAQLDNQFALKSAFSGSDVDIFSRFAGLDWDDSFEALHRYYQKRVNVELDTLSSITTLSVSAFTPEMAYLLNEKLLKLSEGLVNQLNERGRQDMIRFAAAEVVVAEKKAKEAALALSAYRNRKGVFNPEGQSALQLQQVSKIQEELIASKIQLAQLISLTKDNPQIPALKKRIETLQAESDAETAKVAGGNRSLSDKSAEYEGLALERSFAERQLAAALTSLEQARNDAQRKQLYLERIVQPGMPDVAVEPRRMRSVFATFVLGLVTWGILTMLIAGIREHQD